MKHLKVKSYKVKTFTPTKIKWSGILNFEDFLESGGGANFGILMGLPGVSKHTGL